MATFPRPSEIEVQYFRILKSIKPSINVNDPNSDFVIRGKVISGVISGIYGDQAKINSDTYIRSARPEALDIHGADLGLTRNLATYAQSPTVEFTGTGEGVVIPVGQTLRYAATNIEYLTLTQAVIEQGKARVSVRATTPGSLGNVQAPDELLVINPPQKVNNQATLIENLADGSDAETDDAFRLRLLSRYQEPPAGGNETDYINLAFKADPSVRSAFIRRFGRGLGTVDVYITTGTTDIDTAVTGGIPVVRTPSSIVLSKVLSYFEANVPLTDCPGVYSPTEVAVNVSVSVTLAPGLSQGSIPVDAVNNPLNLTCGDLIKREVSRVLYNLPVGGRVLSNNGLGYVVASDIEENLDKWLSANINPLTRAPTGKIPILVDRQVMPLDGASMNRRLYQNEIAAPGIITITLGVV